MVLRVALGSAPPRDAMPAPAVWGELDGAMRIAATYGSVPREQFRTIVGNITGQMRGWRLDEVMLDRACHRWSAPPHRDGHDHTAIAAFLRAAGVDTEFRQAMSGVGNPTEDGIRAVLFDFYARNHPECVQ